MKRAIRRESDTGQPGFLFFLLNPLVDSDRFLDQSGVHRKEKFAFSPTRPSVDPNFRMPFDFGTSSMSPSAEVVIQANTEIQEPSLYPESVIFVDFDTSFSGNLSIIRPVAKLDQEKPNDIRKDRFRTLEEIDPYLQEKAREVASAWKNQRPVSLSEISAQIRRNHKR
jgi:hypothetical protein